MNVNVNRNIEKYLGDVIFCYIINGSVTDIILFSITGSEQGYLLHRTEEQNLEDKKLISLVYIS